MTTRELVTSLRAVADLYEAHPDLPIPYLDPIHAFMSKEEAPVIAHALGRCEKIADDSFFRLRKKLGQLKLDFLVARDEVCERVVVGTKHVPALHIPAHEEDIVEWKCPKIMEPQLLPAEGGHELREAEF